MGASSNMPPAETQLQPRKHLVHRNTANAATENMTLDIQLRIVRKTGSGKHRKQDAIGSKCSHIEVHGHQSMIFISNNASFRLKPPGVPDGSDGSDGTSYHLKENYTLPVAQAMGRIA